MLEAGTQTATAACDVREQRGALLCGRDTHGALLATFARVARANVHVAGRLDDHLVGLWQLLEVPPRLGVGGGEQQMRGAETRRLETDERGGKQLALAAFF